MSFSALFIRRPVATILIAIAMVVAGGFAYFQLPVAALPNVEFPVISVSASLPGAAPDAMATSVATPLIKQFTQIPAVTSISATSTQGSTSIVLQFDLARNIDQAGADVQAAIDRTLRQLPANMTSPPSYRKTNPADSPIMLVALQSDTQSLTQLDSYAEDVISPALSTLDGVGQVQVFGAKQYAVRVEVQPAAMTARNIGIDQLDAALSSANSITPMGTIANAQQQITLESNATPSNAAEFRQIIIADPAGKPVRLGDVANVIDSVANTQNASSYDGKPAIVLSVFRQPGANTVSVADEVRAALPRFTADLGPSAKISVLNDRSSSVKAAVNDVELTLMVIIGLVVLVIYAFLRRVRATLIPALAVPTSLIVTFGAMYLLGLSIDNISLLGLTLAVGLVVDDAIVMLENIVRHIDEGMAPMEAALKGSSEIGFTIISITVSLVAVFLPVLLMGGVVGKLLNEFAVVVSIAIVASAIISLTLTPMLSARLPAKTETGTRRPPLTERLFAGLLGGYRTALDFCLRLRPAILVVFLLTIVATGWLFMTINKSFLPVEDIGQLNISTQARQDISFPAMQALQDQVVKVVSAQPFVAHVASTVGGGFGASGSNSGSLNVQLTPRRPDLDTVLATLRRELGKVPGISSFVVPVQDFQLGGRSSASQYQFVVEANNSDDLYTWAQRLTAAMQQDGGHFADVTNDIRNNALQAQLVVDQQRASLLGITQQQLRSTLYSDFGTNQATTIYGSSDSYPVIVELDPSMNWGSNELDQIQIRSTTTGKLVPLSAFATGRAQGGDAGGVTTGAAAGGDHLVQPAGRGGARHGGEPARRDQGQCRRAHQHHHLAGRHRPGVPAGPGQPAAADRGGDRGDLYRAGDPLRELHPPADHPDRLALGGHGGAAVAAIAAYRSEHHRHYRAADADRHRQEERHHDGGFRAAATTGRDGAVRCHPRGLPDPLPADHDDHDGGDHGHAADRAGAGRQRRTAPAAGRGGGGRADRFAGADPVRDAGDLSLHGAVAGFRRRPAGAAAPPCTPGEAAGAAGVTMARPFAGTFRGTVRERRSDPGASCNRTATL